ncbi:hypothetical protein LINPERPRIM_LOCUS3120 [Linum perenne]
MLSALGMSDIGGIYKFDLVAVRHCILVWERCRPWEVLKSFSLLLVCGENENEFWIQVCFRD